MKQKTIRYLFLLLLVFALPILMLPNNAGAWSYTHDGSVAAGIVSGGGLGVQGLTYSGKATASHSAIFGGWSISSMMANYVNNYFVLGKTPTANITYNCLACHTTDSYGGAHDKTPYLLTGHKNMGRKVNGGSYDWEYGNDNCGKGGTVSTGCVPASPSYTTSGRYWWGGPTGGPEAIGQQSYITDSAVNGDTINWVTGQLITSTGATSTIYYTTIHGWMDFLPLVDLSVVSTTTGNSSNAELCGECHHTGATDSTANVLGGNGIANYNFLTAAQPDASTSAAIKWAAGNDWVLDGVQCTQCHDATPTSANWQWSGTPGQNTDSHGHPIAMGYSIYEGSTQLCYSCHQTYESGYVDGSSGGTSNGYKAALSGKLSANTPNFGLSHGTPSIEFFNSPHARFTGTVGSNAQGTRGNWGTYVYTTPSGVKTTIATTTLNVPNDQAWMPSAYSSLFKNAVSGDPNEGRNYGCAEVCHDPHITTVDEVNAQPMQISCNGYTNTATGAAGAGGLGANTGATGQGTIQSPSVYNCHQSTNTAGGTVNGAPLSVTSAGDPLAIDLTQINHPVGVGTPLSTTSGDPSQASDACVTCHMPRPDNGSYNGNGGSSEVFKLHYFRINTDVNYSTFPAYTDNSHGVIGYNNNGVLQQANTQYDGSSFPGAASIWVDLDLACGQCHGGGATQNFTTGSIAANLATLTINNSGAANAAVANMQAGDRITIVGSGIANDLLVAGETGAADQHSIIQKIIPGPTAYTITLTEKASTTVSNAEVNTNPTKNGANYFPKSYLAAMAANMHNQTAQVSVATSPLSTVTTVGLTATMKDASTSGANITVNWGDGNLSGNAAVSTGVAGGTFTHTYPSAGKYTVIHTASTGAVSAIENIGPLSVPVSLAVSGIVYEVGGSTPLAGATVILKQNGIVKKIATSAAVTGAYSLGNVPYGTYSITAYAAGYTFTPTTVNITATTTTENVTATY